MDKGSDDLLSGSKGGHLSSQLKKAKWYFKKWLKQRVVVGSQLKKLEEDLASVEKSALSFGWSLGEKRLEVLLKIGKEIRLKEQKLRQTLRIKWLKEGDRNSRVWKRTFVRKRCGRLCECDGNKAPCSDGLNLNFIKANWEAIKGDFMAFICEFYEDGSMVKDLNCTFIALIPKKVKPNSIKDYRPISLVGSMYKIFAKVFANRLKKVMNSVIDPNKMAFVKDRQIIGNL
ncbi:hypothetical protein Dsin_003290 [Dipteronia sinensis]|uniref:Reverse transcriptase domain-containing protein n=1 Tax=Dipteronia sinensis TaxID=43782 RepID=A0AAE0B979_9ROSI|nr:hypothetical protein Dsin_003290 [Dipteronia sinensis]